MLKKHIHFALFLAGFLFLLSFSYCFALEVQTPQGKSGYPSFPFVPQITEQSTLPNYFVYYFGAAMYIAGALALIMLAVAGIQLIASAGNPERISEAKKKATSAVLGLVLLFASFIIINTINPRLQNLEPSAPLKQVGGLLLSGPGGTMPAYLALADISSLSGKYNQISWPEFTTDSAGNQIRNCNPATDYPYLIYWYKEKNFKKVGAYEYIECGGNTQFTWALSYIMRVERPGVYFYATSSCKPKMDSNEMPPSAYTKSIPEWNGLVGSIWIVNGLDKNQGPFFGAILFNSSDYKTGDTTPMVQIIPFETGSSSSRCIAEGSSLSDLNPIWKMCSGNTPGSCIRSVAIFKWVGKDAQGNILSAGSGVTLYSRPNWTGGSYYMSDLYINIEGGYLKLPLENFPVNYEVGTDVPEDEQKKCPNFSNSNRCLKSMYIDGNYLVVVMSGTITGSYAEAFPRLGERDGPSNLNLEFMKPKNAYYIVIYPLAEHFQ